MKNNKVSNYIAILMLFFFANAGTFINPAVQACIEAWPEVPVSSIRMLTTLPGIFTVLSMLFLGSLVEKKISYKAGVLMGCGLILAGGFIPFLLAPSWTFVLMMRAVIGIGAGCLGIRNALLLKTVPEDKKTAFTGYGSVLFSLAFILMAPLAGGLAGISWKHTFLLNLLIIPIGLWNLLFLKEPEYGEAQETSGESGNEKLSPKIWVHFAVMFISSVSIYAFHVGISSFFADKGLGSAAASGLSISAYFIGGLLMNVVLGKLQELLKKAILPAALLAVAAGQAVILFFPSVISSYAGGFISGCGYMTMFSILQVYNGIVQPSRKLAVTSTLILAGSQLGVFISPYFMSISHGLFHFSTDVESAFFGCIVCHIIAAVMAVVFRAAPDK